MTLFDCTRGGLTPFAFEVEPFNGADGRLSISNDDTLIVRRDNTEGGIHLWFKQYYYPTTSIVIPAVGVNKRKFRVRCSVRTIESPQTVALVLKTLTAPAGQHVGDRRHRLLSDAWKEIDEWFDVSLLGDSRFRLTQRSVVSSPSQLEIKNIILTEYDPPRSLVESK